MVHEWKESDPRCSPLSNADPVFWFLERSAGLHFFHVVALVV